MTHSEQRRYLIDRLLEEDRRYQSITVPEGEQAQKDLLRSLMNVRDPDPISREFLAIQDEYLTAELDAIGVTDGDALAPIPGDDRIVLWQGDISTLKADAIVNAANCALRGCFFPLHNCIDNTIHSRSGIQLRLTCDEIMTRQGYDEPTGKAKITPAFNLPSKYVIHTVGPIITGPLTAKDCDLLVSCYRSCLALAADSGCHSIAFCCISTGEFHFPKEKAAEIAVATVKRYLAEDPRIERVIFNVFSDRSLAIYQKALGLTA